MTLNALALELIRAHGEDQGDADYVLIVEQWIRDALEELANKTQWRAFVTNTTLATVAGTATYTLPALARDVKYLRDPVSDTDILYRDKTALIHSELDLETQGRPRYFYYQDLESPGAGDYRYEIGLFPVPDAIYSLQIGLNNVPANLLTSSHIPLLSNMILPLKKIVRSYMYLDDEDDSRANRWYVWALSDIGDVLALENSKSNDITRMQQRDIPTGGKDHPRLDPGHFHN